MPVKKAEKVEAPEMPDGQLASAAAKGEEEKPRMMLEPEVSEPVVPVAAPVEQPPAASVGDLARVESASPSVMPVEVEKADGDKGGGWGWLWVIVAFVVGLAIGGGGGYLMWSGVGFKLPGSKSTTPATTAEMTSPTLEPTTAPTATTAVQLNRKDLNLQVLNGSGVAGMASKAKDYLTGLGYTAIATGNAPSNVTQTQIAVKSSKSAYLPMLTKDLTGGSYTVSSQTGSLDASSQYDAVITLGQ